MINMNSLYLAAMIQSIFLICLLLFNRNGKRSANLLLAILIGMLSISLWNTYIWEAGLDVYWKLFNYEIWVTAFLWGPILYLYVNVVAGQLAPSKNCILKHSMFALILFVAQLPLYLANRDGWISPEILTGIHRVIVFSLYIQLALYLYACFQVLQAYNQKLKDNYSNLEKINLVWLTRLISLFALFCAIDMATTVPAFILQDEYRYLTVLMLAESVAIYLIGYFSLSHGAVLFQSQSESKKAKYSNSPLDYSLSTDLTAKLHAIMKDSKIYRKNDLRLHDLAELIGVTPHHLSQLINEHCQNNFYDFVNRYRVEYAANALLNGNRSNITDIAFESGFNNRASFNSSFKKQIGMTPSKYRQQQSKALLKTG